MLLPLIFREMGALTIFFLVCHLLLFIHPSSSLPLCTDLRAPENSKTPLSFCPYSGRVCCNSTKDLRLEKRFQEMNISDASCAAAVKSILCATCDQFAAELFRVESGPPRPVPVLCNTTASATSSLSRQEATSFCSSVWGACQNISILNSPFAPSLQGSTGVPNNASATKLTDIWQSQTVFCNAFGVELDNSSTCFDGKPVLVTDTDQTQLPVKGLCLERIGNGSYINMAAHPDGSNRAFFSNLEGKIWLATIPDQGSGEVMGLVVSSPFVDLTDQVYLDTRFGMLGMAFHPNFAQNGRFFASFNCDKVKSHDCSGRCACNSDVKCDPSKLTSTKGEPCQYHSVIAEFTANESASNPSMATSAKPSEVRRIFTLGLPFSANHGGQILFGPKDGHLYFMMGDGGGEGDPYNFAQNKKSLLGKILRIDVDTIPSNEEIADLGLWGNYSIPRDNPYAEDKELEPEIWALGLRNPWRCSFDSERPSYFLCADVGENQYEEVDVITKGGNFGWRVYEGPLLFTPQETPGGNTSANSIDPIFPVAGYSHSEVNKLGSAAIQGGYFYRSLTDPCLYGSYLYADLYAGAIWAAAETPKNSGNFTRTSVPFSCAHDSPIHCGSVPNSPLPALEYISSFGEDNRKDIYILASSGVYRVVRPSRCNYTCSKENLTTISSPSPPPPSSSSSDQNPIHVQRNLTVVLYGLLILMGIISWV